MIRTEFDQDSVTVVAISSGAQRREGFIERTLKCTDELICRAVESPTMFVLSVIVATILWVFAIWRA